MTHAAGETSRCRNFASLCAETAVAVETAGPLKPTQSPDAGDENQAAPICIPPSQLARFPRHETLERAEGAWSELAHGGPTVTQGGAIFRRECVVAPEGERRWFPPRGCDSIPPSTYFCLTRLTRRGTRRSGNAPKEPQRQHAGELWPASRLLAASKNSLAASDLPTSSKTNV